MLAWRAAVVAVLLRNPLSRKKLVEASKTYISTQLRRAFLPGRSASCVRGNGVMQPFLGLFTSWTEPDASLYYFWATMTLIGILD